MTAWFRTRGRAEDFSARLEGSLPGPRGSADTETERLVGVVRTLRAQSSADPSATPREAFARELRERLIAEAPSALTGETTDNGVLTRKRGSRERRLVAAATAAVVLGGSVGVATASQGSLPGDTLYPVKRTLERADVALSGSPAARGRDLLHQATDRLEEARALLAEDDGTRTALVPGTLQAFTGQGREGAKLLLGDYGANQRPASVLTVRRFAAASLKALNALSTTAPVEARPVIREGELMLTDIDARASALCATCADLPDLRLAPTFEVSTEVTRARAEANSAKLEPSRPAIVKVPAPKAREATAVGLGSTLTQPEAQAPAPVSARASARASASASARAARPTPARAPAPEVVLPRPPAARPAAPRTSPTAASAAPVSVPSVTTRPKVPKVTKVPTAAGSRLPTPLQSLVVSPHLPTVKDKVEVLPPPPQRRSGLPKTVLPEIDGSVGKPGQ